jgi:hypothetical protein
MEGNDINLEDEVKKIYTPLSVAKEEIWRRWNDKELKKKVEDFLGGDVPEFFKKDPKAILSRDVISPNKEFFYFLDLAEEIKLDKIFIEYLDGKFVAKNFNKYHLCKMFFHDGNGKKGGDRIDTSMIVNFNKFEGEKMKNIETIQGEDFVGFHHDLTRKAHPDIDTKKIFDFSDWFNSHREMSEYYYLHYLALFLVHGVLFDNFILSNGEKDFTKGKILPSFHKLTEIFGVKPIVVPLTPRDDESGIYWWCYSNSIKELMCKKAQ